MSQKRYRAHIYQGCHHLDCRGGFTHHFLDDIMKVQIELERTNLLILTGGEQKHTGHLYGYIPPPPNHVKGDLQAATYSTIDCALHICQNSNDVHVGPIFPRNVDVVVAWSGSFHQIDQLLEEESVADMIKEKLV